MHPILSLPFEWLHVSSLGQSRNAAHVIDACPLAGTVHTVTANMDMAVSICNMLDIPTVLSCLVDYPCKLKSNSACKIANFGICRE